MVPDTKICQACISEGKRSQVGVMTEQTRGIDFCAYYDEDGKLHSHDPNYVYIVYKCSSGHTEEEKRRKTCWCGWGKDEPNQAKQ